MRVRMCKVSPNKAGENPSDFFSHFILIGKKMLFSDTIVQTHFV